MVVRRHEQHNRIRTRLLNREMRCNGSGRRGGTAFGLKHDALKRQSGFLEGSGDAEAVLFVRDHIWRRVGRHRREAARGVGQQGLAAHQGMKLLWMLRPG